jgi:hypothetical protein
MSLFKGYKISEARKIGNELGRQGISIEALEAVNHCDGSYKGVMELCGKLLVLADCATFDSYWQEQVERGISREVTSLNYKLEQLKEKAND